MTAAPAPKGVDPVAGDGRGASSRPPTCPTCGFSVPTLSAPPTLDELIVAALREHPEEGLVIGRLAQAVHRRRVDVEAGLARLAKSGIVTRGKPRGVGRGSRGRPWTLEGAGTHLGRTMEPQGAPVAAPVASSADSLFVALLAAVAFGETRAQRIAAAAGLVLLVVGALALARLEHEGRS